MVPVAGSRYCARTWGRTRRGWPSVNAGRRTSPCWSATSRPAPTAPDRQSQGIGTALIRAAEQLAAQRGHERIGMGVDDHNQRAAALYLRLGYNDTGCRYLDRYHVVDEHGSRHEVADACRFLVKAIGLLRLIGYWDGPMAPDGWPDVCDFVAAVPDFGVQRSVVAYLRSGTVYVAAGGVSVCRLCGAANGNTEQTDGVHFVWPEGLAHYVEEHAVRLPEEVVAVAARGPAPAVDLEWFTRALRDTGELVIDADWWRSRGGSPGQAGHLAGCRRSGLPASWD